MKWDTYHGVQLIWKRVWYNLLNNEKAKKYRNGKCFWASVDLFIYECLFAIHICRYRYILMNLRNYIYVCINFARCSDFFNNFNKNCVCECVSFGCCYCWCCYCCRIFTQSFFHFSIGRQRIYSFQMQRLFGMFSKWQWKKIGNKIIHL